MIGERSAVRVGEETQLGGPRVSFFMGRTLFTDGGGEETFGKLVIGHCVRDNMLFSRYMNWLECECHCF